MQSCWSPVPSWFPTLGGAIGHGKAEMSVQNLNVRYELEFEIIKPNFAAILGGDSFIQMVQLNLQSHQGRGSRHLAGIQRCAHRVGVCTWTASHTSKSSCSSSYSPIQKGAFSIERVHQM